MINWNKAPHSNFFSLLNYVKTFRRFLLQLSYLEFSSGTNISSSVVIFLFNCYIIAWQIKNTLSELEFGLCENDEQETRK